MQEKWKEIEGYNGRYSISNLGRVANGHGLIMRTRPSKDGYVRILLFKDRKYKSEYVHILVANHFLEKPDVEKVEVNHIDGVKSNNVVSNLEWVTRSQNTQHAIRNGFRFVNPSAGKYGKDSKTSKPVAQCDLNGNLIKVWESREEAAKHFNTTRGTICRCVNKKRKTCCGFVWKNPEELI